MCNSHDEAYCLPNMCLHSMKLTCIQASDLQGQRSVSPLQGESRQWPASSANQPLRLLPQTISDAASLRVYQGAYMPLEEVAEGMWPLGKAGSRCWCMCLLCGSRSSLLQLNLVQCRTLCPADRLQAQNHRLSSTVCVRSVLLPSQKRDSREVHVPTCSRNRLLNWPSQACKRVSTVSEDIKRGKQTFMVNSKPCRFPRTQLGVGSKHT